MATGSPTGLMPLLTDTTCIDCNKRFRIGDSLHLATIKYAIDPNTEFDVTDPESGELLYEPLFFDGDCWQEVMCGSKERDGLYDVIADQPPVKNSASIIDCYFCGSGILPFEVYGHIQFGEMRTSPSRPGGRLFPKFDGTGGVQIMCISCMSHVCESVLQIWDDVGQQGECAECQHVRCWREDTCSLECDCHNEEEEEDEELYERGDRVAYTAEFLRQVPSGFQVPKRGTVQTDQEPDEDDVDILWSDGTRSSTNKNNIELV